MMSRLAYLCGLGELGQMKTRIAAMMAVAGLAAGAHAQTISGSGGNASFTADVSVAIFTPPSFTYDYVATAAAISPGAVINQFAFNFQEPVQFLSASNGFSGPLANSTSELFTFTNGSLTAAPGNNSASFRFFSTDPPNGYVGIDASIPGAAGGTSAVGPLPACTCVPESSTLGLLAGGLAPMAVIAYRRRFSEQRA